MDRLLEAIQLCIFEPEIGSVFRPQTKDFVKIECKDITFWASKYKPTISRNKAEGREHVSQENIDEDREIEFTTCVIRILDP